MDVRINSRLKPLWLLALIALLTGFLWGITPMVARAEDNSSTVPGNPTYTEDAFYYSDQYMWKASLFVAKSDTVNKDSSNMNDFYRIGNQAVYLTPVSNWNGWAGGSRPSNMSGLFFSKENKVDTLMELQSKGGDVNALDPIQLASGSGVYIMTDSDVPYVPQLSDGDIYDNGVIYGESVGNITKVAHYFSDPYKIFGLLNYYAGKQGTSREELVKNLEFTIDGETRTGWNPEGILPNVINDNPTNQVEWLIVYEPVSIVYVKNTAHPGSYYGYALSATDFAVSQIKHQMDWRYDETRWTAWVGQQPDAWKANENRQHVSRLAFLLMGNSVITNSTWYGLAAGSGVDQNAAIPFNRWFSDQQVKYGGWGMARALKPAEYNKPRDNDYRPNTDVILSTPVYSNISATPGSELTVTYKINGEVIGTDSLVAPVKTESYSYIKWHTPDVSAVTSYDLEMSISPYPEGTINSGGNEYTHRTLTIRPLEESTPPDPKVDDTLPTDLPANLVPPISVPGEDTADETVAPVIKSIKAVTEAPYYKNETVKIEVVTNRATKNLTFTNTDSGVGKQFGSDSLGDGMLISRSVNELANEIVWTIEFVPVNLGTNHYAFKSLSAAAGESEVFSYDVEVVVDPDIPVIYDVLINPVQALYTLYEEVVKTPLTYEVYFNTNGGNEISTQSAEYNTLLTEPGQPVKEGYSFKGWFKDSGYSEPWNFESDRIMGVTTLYTKWEINTYTVHFDSQGGSDAFSPITVEYGSNIEEPTPSPTRSNYTFLGWFKEIGCNTPWNFTEDTITGDTTLYGKWDATALTVTFDSQGGSLIGLIHTDYGTMISKPNDPHKPGFTFKGWYQEAACNTVWTFVSDRVNSDLTLFAKWDVNLYTVTFDSQGGSAVLDQKAQNESVTSKPADPLRSGYSFGGWFKEDSGTTPWDFTVEKVTRDMTLFALWTTDEAAIEFVTNNGTDVPKMIGATDREILDTSMPITVRDGYTFSGWFAHSDFSGDVITALPGKYPIGTTIYYAKWTANPAFIEFVTNGGSDVATMTGVTDQAITPTTMPATSRAGYTFSGWFAEADFSGTEVTALPGQYPIGTTTYYAKWTANPAAIEFIVNGGSTVSNMTGVTDQEISDTTMPTTSRAGYTFSGWHQEADFSGAEVTALPGQYPIGTTTYYAKWTADPATIEFNVNGGSEVTTMTGVTDQAIAPTTMPTTNRAGYTFSGWFAEADFSGVEVTALPGQYPIGTTTYYAKWTANPAAIEFVVNGGSTVSTMNGVTDRAITDTTMPTTTRTGYVFENWYENGDCSGDPVTILPNAFPVGTKTYYAKWTPIKYAVSFDSQSGSAVDPQMVDYDTLAVSPASPTRTEYTFSGWYQENGCTTPWNFSTDKITNDVTLYAGWILGIPDASVPLEYWSWAQINRIAELGLGESYFDVGETKTVSIAGTTYMFAIYDFNHDERNESGKTNITFGMQGLMVDKHYVNPSKTNNYGWDGSDVRAYLNGTTTINQYKNYTSSSVISKMPSDLRSIIIPVKKYTSGGHLDQTIKTSVDNIFLFSNEEIYGTNTNSLAGEGYKYSIFTNNASRVKKYPNASLGWWWTRSPVYGWSTNYLAVNTNGGVYDWLLSNADIHSGINFGFAIGNAPTNTYPVTYNTNGGSAISSTTATLNTLLTKPAVPTKSGFTIVGWYKDAGLTQPWDFANDKITGATTLYAKWVSLYTVTFNAQGGSAVGSKTAAANTTITSPGSPVRTGYSFGGWFKESGCTNAWNFASDVVTSNRTLYAKWTINTYTVLFNSNGGSAVTGTLATLNTTITAPTAPTKANAIFDGWYKDAGLVSNWNFVTDKVVSNMTLYAKWKTLPPMGNPLSSYTWDEIGIIADEGLGDVYFNVGDTKDMAIERIVGSTEVVTVQIYGFDHDELSSGSGKANITFGLKNVMRWSNSYNTYLYPNNNGGWKDSSIRANLNGIVTTNQETDFTGNQSIYSKLPSDVRSNIDSIKKYSSNGSGSLFTTNDKLFLFSEKEVTGANTGSLNGEGERYEIFTNANSMIKANPEVSIGNCSWLLRSPTENLTNHLGIITQYGGYSSLSSGSAYTTFGFCMGTAKDLPRQGTALKDCSWQQVANVANAGKGDDYWNVGDTKDMTLSTGEVVTMQVYDFNHDDKSDGGGKANITFGMENLLNEKHSMMNAVGNNGGWSESEMRGWLNGIDTIYSVPLYTPDQDYSMMQSNCFLPKIPIVVRNNIVEVHKYTSNGANDKDTMITTTDKLFLFSQEEVFNSNRSQPANSTQVTLNGEGYQYKIFESGSNHVKQINGTNAIWRLRSPYYGETTGFIGIIEGGENTWLNALGAYGVSFGFCLGTAPKYTVTFNSQGGTTVSSKTAEINTTTSSPATPTKSGQTFAGWFKDAAGTTEWNFITDKVTGPTTLYAKWITLPAIGTSLEACSWDQIAYISKAGLANTYFDVGNTKNITLSTNEVLTMQIYDFNHDDKSDGSGKVGITFGTKNLMATSRVMNPNGTNYVGWNGTDLRGWMNAINTIYASTDYTSGTTSLHSQLPADLRTAIKPVKKLTSGGDNNQVLVTSNDKIFTFSEKECFGTNYYTIAGEGTKYPIFTDNASRIKKLSNGTGSAMYYWGRSPYSSNNTSYFGVHNDGSYVNYGNNPAHANYGVAFGFCV
ncbi:InlB B-repeat-containing protein [Acetobacterium sp.]|uniref:InlB B-repeat-containing protein n=1 Tax=Acetobacterium sp. TaxID=1872094 RepID=UPI00272500A8|nr:InlB B-repeat-containing protein [Acetobacterium sp.]MDO9491993.1 InlB B-repeat-containing protein [Acetobacterium sp.]